MNRSERTAWNIALLASLALSLWPIWSVRFPAMQDYPQHLLQAYVLRARGDPAWNFHEYFQIHFQPTYAAFYALTLLFSYLVSIETAGKLSISLYVLLVGSLALRLNRGSKDLRAPRWGALLFFPLAFNQQYFQGNMNYLFSLPLLIHALLDQEDQASAPWDWRRYVFWLLLLIFTHPFTFLAYVAFTLTRIATAPAKVGRFQLGLRISALAAFIFYLAFFIGNPAVPSPKNAVAAWPIWLPLRYTFAYLAIMFTGIRWWRPPPDWTDVIAWAAIGAIILRAIRKERPQDAAASRPYKIFLGLALLGILVLPLKTKTVGFVNLRISAIAYFLLAVLASRADIRGRRGYALAGLVFFCLARSIRTQTEISRETQEIVPILQEIPPNSLVLPLVFDHNSAEIERFFFDVHLHDHIYYHLLVGGGYDPYIFNAPPLPLSLNPGIERPAPGEYLPQNFSWKKYSADYQYFLVRSAPEGFARYMERTCSRMGVSGRWMLFKRNP